MELVIKSCAPPPCTVVSSEAAHWKSFIFRRKYNGSVMEANCVELSLGFWLQESLYFQWEFNDSCKRTSTAPRASVVSRTPRQSKALILTAFWNTYEQPWVFHWFVLYFFFRCGSQLRSARHGEHIQIVNDPSRVIRRELRQSDLVWMINTFANIFQNCASKGWKSFTALGHPDLNEAEKKTPRRRWTTRPCSIGAVKCSHQSRVHNDFENPGARCNFAYIVEFGFRNLIVRAQRYWKPWGRSNFVLYSWISISKPNC